MHEQHRECVRQLPRLGRSAARASDQPLRVAQTLGQRLQQNRLRPDLDEHVGAQVELTKRCNLIAESNRPADVLPPVGGGEQLVLRHHAGHVGQQRDARRRQRQTCDGRFHGVENWVHRTRMESVRNVEALRADPPALARSSRHAIAASRPK